MSLMAKKDNPVQYEIAENKYLDLPSMFMDAKVPFLVTPIIYDESWKKFQDFYRIVGRRRS